MSNVGPGGMSAYVTLGGDASGVVNAANQANNALASLSQGVSQNWWGIRQLSIAFSALPAAIAGGAGMAIKSAIEWEDAMFTLSRTMGDTDAEVNAVGESILAMARNVPLATTELAGLAATGAQLGIANEALDTFAETMGLLISSTNLTEANVGDLARIMNVMGIPEAEMEQFSNTILEVGRNTAATESDIANIARRMSGAAAISGFTTAQLLGVSAAILSLGPRAEAGGTAFNKTISDMTNAVASGSDELEVFAKVSGKTVDEFVTLFRKDAAAAFASFISGLVRLKGGSEAAYQALAQVGITEARQTQALLQLAQGTLDVGNEHKDLNAILGFTNQAWTDSNALQDIAAKKAQTVSGQIQLLKNAIFEAGNTLGQIFLPIIGFVIQRVLDFIAGIGMLPTPVKVLVGTLILLTAALSGVAAIALIIGPRLVLAYVALQNFTAGGGRAAAAAGTFGGAAAGSVGGVHALTQAVINLTLAMMRAEGASINAMRAVANVGTASAIAGAKANASGGGVLALGGKLGKVGKVAGVVGLALTALGIATSVMGNKSRNAASDQKKAQDALEKSTRAQAAQAKASSDAIGELSDSEEGLGGSSDKANKALRKQIELLTQIADAVNSLVDAEGQQRNAQLALAEAQDDYARALDKQAHASEEVAEAERKVEIARRNAVDAADELREKELAVADAREVGVRRLRDAEFDLADARDDQREGLENIREIEENIAELRAGSAEALIKATNDLRDAQLSLVSAERTVADAEFNLQRLREEGASARDIADAELAVAEARAEAANASEDLNSAQKDLNDFTSGKALAEAERDLAEARRDALRDTDKIIEKEEELAEARRMVAEDTDYLNAQRDVLEAQNKVSDALEATRDAELDLAEIRNGSLDREALKAQFALEDAIIGVAKANVEVRRQTALAAGQTFDAADAAHALGEELSALSGLAPTPEAQGRLQTFIDTLRSVRDIPTAPEEGGGGGFSPTSMGLPDLGEVPDYFKALQDEIDKGAKETKKKATFSIGGALSGALTGAALGYSLGPWGALGGAIIGAIIGGFGFERVKDAIVKGLKWVTSGSELSKAVKNGLIGAILPGLGSVAKVIDLKGSGIGRALEVGFKALFGLGEDGLKRFKSIANSSAQEIQRSFTAGTTALQTAFANSGRISKEEADNVIGEVERMRSTTVATITDMADKRIASIKYLRDQTKAIGKEEADAMIAEVVRKREKSVENENKRAHDIATKIQELREKGVNVTAGMVNEVIADYERMRDQSVIHTEQMKSKQEALLLSLANSTGQISEKEKNKIIKDAETTRDKRVRAAHETAGGLIAKANDAKAFGVMSEELYRKTVKEATDARDATIAAANHTASETIRHAERLAVEVPPKAATAFGSVRREARDTKGEVEKISLYDSGKSIIEGLFNGLKDKFVGWFKSKWNGLIDQIPGGLADRFKMRSPSRLFAEMGENIIKGLWMGLENEQTQLARVLQETAGMMEEELAKDYVSSFQANAARQALNSTAATMALASRRAQAAATNTTTTTHGDTLNLTAITSADPAQIVNEYIWEKRVRLRGGG